MEFNYNPISKHKLSNLTAVKSPNCVTMYVPTYKEGKEQNRHLAQGHLKSCIRKATNDLLAYQLTEKEVSNYLLPVDELLEDIDIWRKPSEGLVLFLHTNGLELFKIPMKVEELVYVADHFYLKPIARLFADDINYYLLELSRDYIKLYEASRYSLKEVFIDEFTPDKLEQEVGFDFKQKMLQFRTGQAAQVGAGSFHGHGEGRDEYRLEIEKFFRAINRGLQKVLNNKNPLLISCVDFLFPLYKSVNSYPFLLDENLSGDTEFIDKKELHVKSWELVFDLSRQKQQSLKQFDELKHTTKTSVVFDDSISAAVRGKVDTLFIHKDADIFGNFDLENDKVTIDTEKNTTNKSLINLAVISTFEQGGKVYELDISEMPDSGSPINAIFRF